MSQKVSGSLCEIFNFFSEFLIFLKIVPNYPGKSREVPVSLWGSRGISGDIRMSQKVSGSLCEIFNFFSEFLIFLKIVPNYPGKSREVPVSLWGSRGISGDIRMSQKVSGIFCEIFNFLKNCTKLSREVPGSPSKSLGISGDLGRHQDVSEGIGKSL